MRLTPLEVRKQSFRRTMRGFDPEEVRIFLDMVADEYEKAQQENGMLSEKVRYLNERLEEYHGLEKTLQSSILTAERIAAESRERSRLEAETITNDAHVRAERILEDSRSRLRMLGEQIHHLSTQKNLFMQRFQSLLDAQIQFLQGHQEELEAVEELDARASGLISDVSRDLGAPEEEPSGAMEERRAESVASTPAAAQPVDPNPQPQGPQGPDEIPADKVWSPREEPAEEADDGFFEPQERREGFFELNANTGAQEGVKR